MKLLVEIEIKGEAFDDSEDPTRSGQECGRILRRIADRLADYGLTDEYDGDARGIARDVNGQAVGEWKVMRS